MEIRGILWGDMRLMRADFSWVFDFVIIFWVIVWWELGNVVDLQSEFWTSPARVWTPNSGRLAFHDRSSCFILIFRRGEMIDIFNVSSTNIL